MANITTNTNSAAWGFSLGGVFRAMGEALVTLSETNSRVRRVEALQALSDDQLAAKGLKREDIARHVFGDMFYL
ncbi:leucyl-tRNA synthetase [Aestuariivita boseongensis]|uniref:leucyl-tRNA synthetase n=1 Tax=Aestuariivita boseongensis TaxID=1470562 RepID=UPI000681098D|nr:leucyl-tRNA synthetase [Aestuariivita boseongensis]